MIQRACPWTSGEIAKATGGELLGAASRPLSGVATDTRDPLAGQLFVALSGERFDGHDFLAAAIEKGAASLLVSRAGLERARSSGFVLGDVPCIVTEDSLRGLGDLGHAHRLKFRIPVLALTGSNGKTTTKELLSAVLAVSSAVLKTEGNLNNLIGVPMTLLGLTGAHRAAVIEMGMNQKGEIARYTEITEPDLGLVLNVGPAHIGMLGSLEAIADAKGELYRGLDRTRGIAVVNADDPLVMRAARASGVERVRTFGRSEAADVRLLSSAPSSDAAGGQSASFSIDGRGLSVELPMPGEHNALNAAAAIAAATATAGAPLPVSLDDLARGLPKAMRIGRRMIFESIGKLELVDDCYNANSASMRAAIDTVSGRAIQRGRRFVALLGEMRELGDYAAAEHRSVGEALVDKGAKLVGTFGPLARPIADAARRGGIEAHHEDEDAAAMLAWLDPRLQDGDVVLVKGSRGIRMERFVEQLRARSKENR